MGRHSSSSQFHYYRSVFGWFLPWLLVAAVVGVGVWVAVDVLGGTEIEEPPSSAAVATASPSATPEDEASETPTPTETESADPEKKKKKKKDDSGPPELITEGITVQVLNATTGNPDADDQMADKLAEVGYEVIALGGANRVYQRTTVLWSFAEAREAAERLAQRFGWDSGPKPSNLSTQVDLHVVVGEDFSG